MSLVVHAATLDDLDDLLMLDRACFARAWTREQWRAELEPEGAVRALVLIAHADARPIAHACAPMLDDRCELRRIGVVAQARGRGVGRDLIARVIDHAKQADCTRIELEVAADNVAAIALYRRAGFRTVGVRPRYYRDPPADAVLMDLVWTPCAGSPM
jgi:ribosomal-protein-alanine N-acetyltransferase